MCERTTPKDTLRNVLRESAGFRLAVLFGTFFVAIILAASLGAVLSSIPGFPERGALLISSAFQCVVAFCLPAYLTARFASFRPGAWLSLSECPSAKAFIGVVIVYLLAMPAMNQLIAWNQELHFPDAFQSFENILRTQEEAAAQVSGRILGGMDFLTMLVVVVVVGVLTGFSEELFFRGALQKIFLGKGGKETLAIWSSAVIFSAIHFQFFGFFPRLLMGAFFGYLLVWSRSLWVAVFAHTLNNSIVVVGCWLSDSNGGTPDVETFGVVSGGNIPWAALASLVATTLFLWRFRTSFFKN